MRRWGRLAGRTRRRARAAVEQRVGWPLWPSRAPTWSARHRRGRRRPETAAGPDPTAGRSARLAAGRNGVSDAGGSGASGHLQRTQSKWQGQKARRARRVRGVLGELARERTLLEPHADELRGEHERGGTEVPHGRGADRESGAHSELAEV